MLTEKLKTRRQYEKNTQTGEFAAKCHPKEMSEKLCETTKWSDNYNDD